MKVNRRELIFTIVNLSWIGAFVFALNIFILADSLAISSFRGDLRVKAVSVCHKERPFFVTTEQKEEILTLLNEGEIVDQKTLLAHGATFPFKSLLIHRFENSSIEVVPVAVVNEKLVVNVLDGQKETLLVEKSAGKLQTVITKVCQDAQIAVGQKSSLN